ncbi:neurogenin-3-like [Stylophora pistillata]|uniref:Protein atonal-like 1 n=1 Tax=Stylophora pistillata TaxID=50429 RepID=A0A2B4SXG3_STYPI|nr:neurogenin-3-like [Stylophora pistillata]XP_022804042.1 neurogenin-3-like [Stylophora pistillata]PFX33238.1 Protein atonal-like 1 [Stylophora pistillata]
MDSEVPEEETPRATTSKKKTKRRGRRLTGLSKQRRIANTRERNRVHVINEGIDRLRDLIPLFPNEKKPSKTDTIRLAALYISHLTELLEMANTEHEDMIGGESLDEDLSVTSLEFDPFGVESEELTVFFWKDDELSGSDGGGLSSVF